MGNGRGSGNRSGAPVAPARVPDTDYRIPANAVYMATTGADGNPGTKSAPVRTINQAVALVRSGGTIVMRGGVYRDWYSDKGSEAKITTSLTLQPYPHEQVWFDGADPIPAGRWTSDGRGHWSMPWRTPQFCAGHYYDFPYDRQSKGPDNLTGASGALYSSNAGPCAHWDDYGDSSENYPAAGDPQMVIADGISMAEVATLPGAVRGRFFYDWAARRIYISTDPSAHRIELAARPGAMILGQSTSGFTVRGIGFEHYASNEYPNTTQSALYASGNEPTVIDHVVFADNAGAGLHITAAHSSVSSSIFLRNGVDGATVYGHGRTTGETDGFVLRNSVFTANNSEHFGLNCRLSCAAAGIKMSALVAYTVSGNTFENGQSGANGAWCDTDCENGEFVHNLVVDNGGAGLKDEQNNDTIVASNVFANNEVGLDVSSAGAAIFNNTLVDNSLINIRIYDDLRPLIISHVLVGNNVLSGSNTNDLYLKGGTSASQSLPATWFDYFDYNSYWRPTFTVLYRVIGVDDSTYVSTVKFQAAFPGDDVHADDSAGGPNPFFRDAKAGDYRLRRTSAPYRSGGPLPTDVARALSVSRASGRSRGALSWPGGP